MKKAKHNNFVRFCLTTLLTTAATTSAATWTGSAGDNSWNNAGNWDNNVVPTKSDVVIINGDFTANYDVSGNVERDNTTTIAGNSTVNVTGKRFLHARNTANTTMNIGNNATLNHTGEYFIVGTGQPGFINQNGGTVNTNINLGFFINDSTNSTGSSYNLNSGNLNVTYTAGYGTDDFRNRILGRNASGLFNINGGHATFSVNPSIDRRIYISGPSQLNITSGSAAFNGFKWFCVGKTTAGIAELNLSGGTLTYNPREDGAFVVGGEGVEGHLNISGGVMMVNSGQGLWIGDGNGSLKGITMQTGGCVVVANDVVIGRAVTAVDSYYQMDGGLLSCNTISVPAENAAPGAQFIFNGGEIILNGDQTGILAQTWFVEAANTRTIYDAATDTTRIYRNVATANNPTPAVNTLKYGVPAPGDKVEAILSWNTGLVSDPNSASFNNTNTAITAHKLYLSRGDINDPNMDLVATIPASGATASYTATLNYDKPYFWRVDEVAGANTFAGQTWFFTTPIDIPVINQISPAKQYITSGQPVSITTTYSTISPITSVTWYLNGIAIDDAADSNVSVTFDNESATITIDAMAQSYEGNFTCIATNAGGDSVPSTAAFVEMYRAVAYYAFEDNIDDSASGKLGVFAGTAPVSFSDGISGKALALDGIDQFVTITNPVRDDFTIEFYVKTSASNSGSNWYNGIGLIDAEVSGNANDMGSCVLNGKFAFGIGNADITMSSTSSINDGLWHYCVATRNAATGVMEVYVDGELENTVTGPTGTKAASASVVIGKIQTGTNYLTGLIDEVKFYNFVLDELTIADNYYTMTGESPCVTSRRPSAIFDIDGNCIVDIADFAKIAAHWLECGIYSQCVPAIQ